MFMSYKLLDSASQSLVMQAGAYDSLLHLQSVIFSRNGKNLQQEKIQFLSQVKKQDKAASQAYAEKFRLKETDFPSKYISFIQTKNRLWSKNYIYPENCCCCLR